MEFYTVSFHEDSMESVEEALERLEAIKCRIEEIKAGLLNKKENC